MVNGWTWGDNTLQWFRDNLPRVENPALTSAACCDDIADRVISNREKTHASGTLFVLMLDFALLIPWTFTSTAASDFTVASKSATCSSVILSPILDDLVQTAKSVEVIRGFDWWLSKEENSSIKSAMPPLYERFTRKKGCLTIGASRALDGDEGDRRCRRCCQVVGISLSWFLPCVLDCIIVFLVWQYFIASAPSLLFLFSKQALVRELYQPYLHRRQTKAYQPFLSLINSINSSQLEILNSKFWEIFIVDLE